MCKKNGFTFVAMLVVMTMMLSTILVGCAPATPEVPKEEKPAAKPVESVEPVRIAVELPLTGNLAAGGEQMRIASELAASDVNAAGGIKSLGGAPLELIFLDGQGKPEVAMGEVERAIENEDILVVSGGFHSASAVAIAQVTEKLKTPYVVQVAGTDAITQQHYKYFSRIAPNLKRYGYSAISFIEYLNKDGKGIKDVALLYEEGEFGTSVINGFKEKASEIGLNVVSDSSYNAANTQDMTPFITKIKASGAQALICVGWTADALLVATTAQQMGLTDMVKIGISGGYVDPKFAENVGKEIIEQWYLGENWIPALPGGQELNDKYKAKASYNMNGHGANAYQTIYVIADALERAGSRDKEVINKALRETNIEPGPSLFLPLEKIAFDENGDNMYAKVIMCQYKNDEELIVWPPEYMKK